MLDVLCNCLHVLPYGIYIVPTTPEFPIPILVLQIPKLFIDKYGDFQIERNVDFIEQLVLENNLDERGYFIYHAVGTNDAVKSQSLMMAEEILSRNDTFTPDHYVFYQKDGGYHDFEAVQEYMYNALPLFFRQ